MREKNGFVLNVIGLYFLFSFVAGLIIKKDIVETLMLDGLLNNSSVNGIFYLIIIANGLITFLLFYTGIRRYMFYRKDKKDYKTKKKEEEKE